MIPCQSGLANGTLSVSLAGAADAQALLKHARQVAGESDFLKAGPGERTLTPRIQAAFLDRLRTQKLGFVLKGELDGRLVAVLTVVRPPHPRLHHRAELGLTVRRACWGQGIGRRMAALGIRLAQAQGVRKLNLSVRADHQRALGLYRSLGFEEEGISARALRVGRRFFAEVTMGLCLDSNRNPVRVLPFGDFGPAHPARPSRALRAGLAKPSRDGRAHGARGAGVGRVGPSPRGGEAARPARARAKPEGREAGPAGSRGPANSARGKPPRQRKRG